MGKPNLENLKFRVATQVGVNLSDGYNGDITTKQAGLIGGNMVKELIAKAEETLSTTYGTTTATTYGTTYMPTQPTTTYNQTWF